MTARRWILLANSEYTYFPLAVPSSQIIWENLRHHNYTDRPLTFEVLCKSFNRWAQLHTPEYHLSPWATRIRRNITSNLLILPKFRLECIMSGLVVLYFYCMLNHCPLNLEMSLNCQEAVIYFSDIWISSASPFNFSIIQYRVRDKEMEGRNTALVVWCAFLLS